MGTHRHPLRTYRAPDEVYLPALAAAEKKGEPLAEAIRQFLTEYARPKPTPRRHPRRRREDQQQ